MGPPVVASPPASTARASRGTGWPASHPASAPEITATAIIARMSHGSSSSHIARAIALEPALGTGEPGRMRTAAALVVLVACGGGGGKPAGDSGPIDAAASCADAPAAE